MFGSEMFSIAKGKIRKQKTQKQICLFTATCFQQKIGYLYFLFILSSQFDYLSCILTKNIYLKYQQGVGGLHHCLIHDDNIFKKCNQFSLFKNIIFIQSWGFLLHFQHIGLSPIKVSDEQNKWISVLLAQEEEEHCGKKVTWISD